MRNKRVRATPATCVIPGVAALIWAAPAYAYLDPATGSIILQGLLAGIAGLMVALRFYRDQVKAFFRTLLGGKKAPEENREVSEPKSADKARE